MENYLICKCKKVTYADVEDALHNEKTFESVEKFKKKYFGILEIDFWKRIDKERYQDVV